MDEYLARINRIYPNSGFVHIAKYNPTIFEGKKYDSSLDSKVAINKWKTQPLTYEEAQNFVEKGDYDTLFCKNISSHSPLSWYATLFTV